MAVLQEAELVCEQVSSCLLPNTLSISSCAAVGQAEVSLREADSAELSLLPAKPFFPTVFVITSAVPGYHAS